MRKARKQGPSARRLGIESLEDRQLLAGNVAVSLRSGLLTITGDNNSNNISLYQQANGSFTITGNDGEVFTGPTANLQVRNLTVNLNGGDDIFTVSAQPDPFAFDTIPAQILGATTINGGVGDDQINASVIGRLAGTLLIPAAAINLDTGYESVARNEIVFFNNSAAAIVNVNTWAGSDFIQLENVYALTMNVNAGVANNIADEDTVIANGVTAVTGIFNLGTSATTPFAGNSLFIDAGLFGVLNVLGGAGIDNVSLNNTLVGASLTVNTFGGNDFVNLNVVQTGMTQADYQAVALQLAAAFGVDIAQLPFNLFGLINALPTLPGVMIIDTGAGDDFVSMTDIFSTFAIYVYLQAGNDQLRATNVEADYSYFFGGPGTDSRLLTAIDGYFLELQFEAFLPPNP